MLTVGIETSTSTASVALLDGKELLAERILSQEGTRHAQALVSEFDQMLQENGRRMADCERVAVSLGPGSFTGLRIGVVCAKTLAYTLNCPLVPVDTLLAIAANSTTETDHLYATVDAQRGDLYVAEFNKQVDGGWKRANEVSIVAAQVLVEKLDEGTVVTGPGMKRHHELFAARCRVTSDACWNPPASVVARLADQLPALTQFDDLAALEPFYLRKSAAEENWDKKNASV